MAQSSAGGEKIEVSARTGARMAFEVLVSFCAIAALALGMYSTPDAITISVIGWIAVIALVELIQVPFWRLQVSLGFPLLMAVAFVFSPPIAGLIAFVGSVDPREFRREVGPLRAIFNRAQIAISTMLACLVFHALTDLNGNAFIVLGAACLAAATDFVVNVSLVGALISLEDHEPLRKVMPRFVIGNPVEYLVSYFGLGLLGVVMAKLYLEVGFWSIALFVVPLFLARQMFFRTRALEEAHKELKDREQVLARLSNRMAEERQDERIQIANYLHDDLAQLLFQLSLQIDLADRLMREGRTDEAHKVLAEVRATKEVTSQRMRSLVNDLHRSPIGRAGLSEAIRSFAEEVGRDTKVRFDVEVTDLPLPPPIQLLVYQIAHEAVMNALKYAEPSHIEISFAEHDGAPELVVRDDGKGFDPNPDGISPDGHFGLTMMRERAQVTGGTFDLVSAVGAGTGITVRLPSQWLGEAGPLEEGPAEEGRSDLDPNRRAPVEPPPAPAPDLPAASA